MIHSVAMIKNYIKKIDWKSYTLGVAVGLTIFILIPNLFAKQVTSNQVKENIINNVGIENVRQRARGRVSPIEEDTISDEKLNQTSDTETTKSKKPKIPTINNTTP